MNIGELIDLNRVLPDNVEGYLNGAGITLISCVFIVLFLNIKKNKGRIVPVFAGITSYVVFCVLGYNLVAGACVQLIPGMQDAYDANAPQVMVLLTMITAGMYTLARIASMKLLLQGNYNRQGDCYNAGLGLSLGNMVLYGISIMMMIVWCMAIYDKGLEGLFAEMETEEAVKSAYDSILPLFENQAMLWLFLALSYIMDMVLYAALTWLTRCIMEGYVAKIWYFISFVMNAAVLVPFDLYDGTRMEGYLIPFLVKAALLAAVVVVIGRITSDADRNDEDGQKIKPMPKIGNLSKL